MDVGFYSVLCSFIIYWNNSSSVSPAGLPGAASQRLLRSSHPADQSLWALQLQRSAWSQSEVNIQIQISYSKVANDHEEYINIVTDYNHVFL